MNASEVAEALEDVFDPELGIDIVSLGLVYGIETQPGIRVELTTTSQACPMGPALFDMAEAILRRRFPGTDVTVEPIFDPAWDGEMMSRNAREWLGFPQRSRR